MAFEIERRFLVAHDGWREHIQNSTLIRQGFLSIDKDRVVRVRVSGAQAWLTIKGRVSQRVRREFEYPIPLEDAQTMLDTLCGELVMEKTRYTLQHGDHLWELDVFHGVNDGLVLAELELSDEHADFARPNWLGAEVTQDGRYTNAHLSANPYRDWSEADRNAVQDGGQSL